MGALQSTQRSLERGGSLCPPFDLCLLMTQQETEEERRFGLLSNKHTDRIPLFSATYPVYITGSMGDSTIDLY